MEYLFYIHDDFVSTEFQHSEGRTRIFAVPIEQYSFVFKEGEGPFTSIPDLKKKSRIFKEIAKRNSKLANQILEEKNIFKVKDFVFLNRNQGYPKEFINLVEHTIKGQIQRKEVYGIHYFDSTCMRIREMIKSENEVGVWMARIDLLDKNKNLWIQKKSETSFFPLRWSIHQLFHECFFAFSTKVKDESKEYTYLSKTESGVTVEIIIKENQLKSIYPIY